MTTVRVTGSVVEVREVPLGDARMREFVALPWRLYRLSPYWVPQLDGELLGNRLLGLTGLLTPSHPYHREAEAAHFLAYAGGEVVGRVSVLVHQRFNARYRSKVAFFGFFESVENENVAHSLLTTAANWARSRGMEVLRGPGEYASVTHERQGCLVAGFDQPVVVEQTWNPPYYGEYMERFGFARAMDYHAYRIDLTKPMRPKLARIAQLVAARRKLTTRPLDMRRFAEDVHLIIDVYHRAWADNWGFLPVEDWEVASLVRSLRPIIDPELVRFAFDGPEPVAVLASFPDPNVLLRPRWRWPGDGDLVRLARLLTGRRRIDRIRLMLFGIVPGYRGVGADALLYQQTYAQALRRGYTSFDVSLLLDVNTPVIRATEGLGGERTKTWRIYDLAL